MTKEECCSQFTNVNTAWSNEDMDSGSLFFLRILGDGVPCHSCKETCTGVECGSGKKCVMRSGRPKCVCSPCKEKGKNSRGPVCGTDGNTYLNVCRIKKRACRRKTPNLTVAYNGFCQSSCDRIKCPDGKYCLLDQNLSPHCVRCMIRCPKSMENSKPVCGTDGITYENICLLRQMACKKGKAIPVAYKGKCKARASCGSIRCKDRQACLTDSYSGLPRCVTCTSRCPSVKTKEFRGPICGTNNKTYHSWCHMVKDACATGFVIETKFQGICEEGGKRSFSIKKNNNFTMIVM
ncbi:follistatin, putative [Pediculus humanus corporis]|uniref:Follistatin, putative n=1 Tax=Pediculus humanus subsp. corporis TaxID=121224 RepID=E0VQX0_PEDHC|nr:follistatin, putative [Pediculus humanus corporis]EEB15776.1 follistatin, putative [Pediculus humanus corporis]